MNTHKRSTNAGQALRGLMILPLILMGTLVISCEKVQPKTTPVRYVPAEPTSSPNTYEHNGDEWASVTPTPSRVMKYPRRSQCVEDTFKSHRPFHKKPFATAQAIEEISYSEPDDYRIGPGDVIELHVWNRPDVSSSDLIVGPDGIVSFPRLANLYLSDLTRQEAEDVIREELETLYDDPELTLTIRLYNNNRAYVLGRVLSPGMVSFTGPGNLIEAISLAGGILPTESDPTYTSDVSILRGNNQIIWVDLNQLLNEGNLGLNARIRNGDIVYIPPAKRHMVYVMGSVFTPNALVLTPELTFMDALMMTGGPTEDAKLGQAYLLRWDGEDRAVRQINIKHMLETGDMRKNFLLEPNDIIYVGVKEIARLNYFLRQISPALNTLLLSETLLQSGGSRR